MNGKTIHGALPEPPLAFAVHNWDEASEVLSYEYNGVEVIRIHVPGAQELGFRHGSDGSMQSVQYIQQIYVATERPIAAEVTFTLSGDAVCMRPRRAGGNEAILAQEGRPLIHGVGGLYDVDQDLLIDFSGCGWRWLTGRMERGADGKSVARIAVELSEKPFFLNLRMQYYNRHLGYKYHKPWVRKPKQEAVAGWCSWEAYRRDIDIGKIEGISRFLARTLKDYGLRYIQVDDGYQQMPLPYDAKGCMADGWCATDEKKFPGGHRSIVKTVEKYGFLPAIWTNANITNKEFPLYHEDSVLWHDGAPLNGVWIDYVYSCTPGTLEKQVKPIFEQYRRLGYRYVKIDAIRHLLFDGLHEAVRLGMMSNEKAERRFRAYMQATREGLGDDIFYLASWGEMHEVVGLVDACRIAMDANPTWAGIRMQLFESARWFHTQRILFLADPDHVCVRTKPEWAKSILSLISLSGELCMLSDVESAYTSEKLDILHKTLPTLTTRTAETGPLNLSYPAYTWTKLHGFAVQSHDTPVQAEDVSLKDALDMAGVFPTMEDDHPFSSLWAFHIDHLDRRWCVMGRFATMPLRACRVPLSSLGLDEEGEYLAFDFWKQCFLGTVKGEIPCGSLEIGQCQIVALHRCMEIPQLIASSRHVSMDAVSVKRNLFHDNLLELSLEGVPGTSESYYIHVTHNFAFRETAADGGSIVSRQQGELLRLDVEFERKLCSITVRFEYREG